MQDENGNQKKFGFVSFENHEDAEKCVNELNGKEFGDRKLYVSRAQKKVILFMKINFTFKSRTTSVSSTLCTLKR